MHFCKCITISKLSFASKESNKQVIFFKASKALSQSQSLKKKVRSESDDGDATRDLIDPPSVPNVEEVDVPKLVRMFLIQNIYIIYF